MRPMDFNEERAVKPMDRPAAKRFSAFSIRVIVRNGLLLTDLRRTVYRLRWHTIPTHIILK